MAQFIDWGTLDGVTAMTRDADFLSSEEIPEGGIVTAYRWDGVWLSVGRLQSTQGMFTPLGYSLIDSGELRTVLRPTGGNAVLHGHDISVTVACRLPFGMQRDLRKMYRHLISPIVEALRADQPDCVLAEELGVSASTRTFDCFAASGPLDVVSRASGKKLVGIAMRVTKDVALIQCSIPIQEPVFPPEQILADGIPVVVSSTVEILDRLQPIASGISLGF